MKTAPLASSPHVQPQGEVSTAEVNTAKEAKEEVKVEPVQAFQESSQEPEAQELLAEPSPEQPRSQWRSPRKIGLVLAGAIALAAGLTFGWRWWQFQQVHVSTENAQIQGHLSPISAKIPATIQRVLVKEGQAVKVGQPLVALEDQDLQLKIQQAEAQLAIAQAQYQSAADTVRQSQRTTPTQVQQSEAKLAASQSAIAAAHSAVAQAQAVIDTNQANVAQAQTEVEKTQADFRRYSMLYNAGAVSAQQFDTAKAAYRNAQAQLAAAQQAVSQAQAGLQTAQANLGKTQSETAAASGQVAETKVSGDAVIVQKDQQQLAQAQIRQAEAALALAKQQLQYTVINAPISGYVGQLTAQVGQKVEGGQALMALVPLQSDQVYVEANFKETALNQLHIGEKAEVEVDAYPGRHFQATVAGISPATGAQFALIPPDNATGNFNKVVQWVPVRLTLAAQTDPLHMLRPGLSAKVTVDTASAPVSATAQR
ncbi:MAG TPA: HlyD family secretion protein [Stenomitos sp.]